MPYNISSNTVYEAIQLIENQDDRVIMVDQIWEEKKRMESKLNDFTAVEKVYPSDANFFLVKVKEANFVYQQLLEKGIVVRLQNS